MNKVTIALRAVTVTLLALGCLSATLYTPQVVAQTWPERPVKLVVPFPPGGGNDAFARELAAGLQQRLGQAFVVENRAGAAGNIGINAAANSAPDGHTLLVVSNTLVTNPALSANIPYDIDRDFVPISLAAILPVVLAVRPHLPQADLADLVAYARENPGQLSYGSAGVGSPQHLTAEYFSAKVGIDLLHVPFKGNGQIMLELIAGRIDLAFLVAGPLMPHLQAGKIRVLATAGAKRTMVIPDLPTLMQLGVPDFSVDWWLGVLAPAGTPELTVQKISNEIMAVSRRPEFQERLFKQGLEVLGSTPAQFAAVLKEEVPRWRAVTQSANIKSE